MSGSDISVIIVAAGSGVRMGTDVPKQLLPLDGVPILVRTVRRMGAALPGARLVVVVSPAVAGLWDEISLRHPMPDHRLCAGGDTRFESVRRALDTVPDTGVVLVHDGVRPLFSAGLIGRVAAAARSHAAVVPVVAPVDSLRMVAADGSSAPLDRRDLRIVQTPQAFDAAVLKRAYEVAYSPEFTDDASVVERSGVPVTLCDGERANIKITTPEDLETAVALNKKIE